MSDYPEHDKMKATQDDAWTVGEFLEWLIDERGVTLCRNDARGRLEPFPVNIESLLAGYFKIDLTKIEAEKRQMLETQHELNATMMAAASVVESRDAQPTNLD